MQSASIRDERSCFFGGGILSFDAKMILTLKGGKAMLDWTEFPEQRKSVCTSAGKKLAQPFHGDVRPGITSPLKGGSPNVAAAGFSICISQAIKEKPQCFAFLLHQGLRLLPSISKITKLKWFAI